MPTQLFPVDVIPGVEPSTDRPITTTKHYINSDKIRFIDGYPEKIGGWNSLTFEGDLAIEGAPRSIFSYEFSGFTRYLVGTHTKLYNIFGTTLSNITPLRTATTAIPNSLDTYHATLVNDPIATVDGSTTLTFTDAGHKLRPGDIITISGSTDVNGVPAGDINNQQFVRTVDTNTFTIIVSTAATSTGSGGGAAVVRATGIVTVNATAHDRQDGDRVKISGAVDFGGILAADINDEFVIRDVQTNSFDVVTEGVSASSVTGGGGAGTEYQEEIEPGQADTLLGQGYGAGRYGVGLYGVSKTSSTTVPPRLWSHDRFGDLTVSCPGNATGIYQWDSSSLVAPTLVANAPEEVNYVFVSNNIVVALGADTFSGDQKDNAISWSDQGGITEWSAGQSGSDVIEGAGRFLSHASARGENLLFTENQTYTFRYIGGQFIWQTRLLDPSIGVIAQNARVTATGNIYWMGNRNFYMWRGGSVEVIPSNTGSESTLLRYVFNDFNFGQKEKCFAWYNPEFREIWFHYPSAESLDPDRIARLNIDTYVWVPDTLERTAAEYPSIRQTNPYLIQRDGSVYLHENGTDDDGASLPWVLETGFTYSGSDTVQHSAFIPDGNIVGDMTATLSVKDYPFSPEYSKTYTINNTTDRVSTGQNGRYFNFLLAGDSLGQSIELGNWQNELIKGSLKK